MRGTVYRLAAAGACAVLGLTVAGCGSGGDKAGHDEHVLLLSIDGMHQSDLADYVAAHQDSALAKLAARGAQYTGAQVLAPADSFPGIMAMITGGGPKTTGVYYDDTWARDLLPAGTKDCATAAKGAQVPLTEEIDKKTEDLDGGQGLTGLPDGISAMTDDPSTVLDPAKLPVNPVTCKPISPSDYLKVNTVFSVVHAAGQRTAWSDKHPAYQIMNGKGGRSIDDLFTPEIDSNSPQGAAWTKDAEQTQRYDTYKADAVVNEIAGKDHSGAKQVGVPAVFGMNFQAVSVTQKLPASKGYGVDGKPSALLASSLDFVDRQIGRFVAALDQAGLSGKTTIVVTAKHGQSPIKPDALTRVDDKPIIDGIDAEWAATHPQTPKLIAHSIDDAAILWWLADRSPEAVAFAKRKLLAANGTGTDINGNPKPFTASGVDTAQVYAGADALTYFGASADDPRVPDLFAGTNGTVYTAGKSKIAEHGGTSPDDRHVPLLLVGSGISKHEVPQQVSLTQLAPTILDRLGLDPQQLDAVKSEHTATLPS
ncbi:phosphodiesterase [Nocardia yunnanensis]|uniref:Phosphodiesterase n=1 Tax=Nocardia yunnanensis TaxID=2382165 RepID=A0A386ZDD1_9NOCA|nr:alkaline phosphatase family protein [Nocardia yunnanensis]AYF75193.1 phosphodiesterase [Nocardia yunnanensis]